jgi:hypothetical protein
MLLVTQPVMRRAGVETGKTTKITYDSKSEILVYTNLFQNVYECLLRFNYTMLLKYVTLKRDTISLKKASEF